MQIATVHVHRVPRCVGGGYDCSLKEWVMQVVTFDHQVIDQLFICTVNIYIYILYLHTAYILFIYMLVD